MTDPVAIMRAAVERVAKQTDEKVRRYKSLGVDEVGISLGLVDLRIVDVRALLAIIRAIPAEPAADSGADADFKALNEIAAMFGYSLVSETTTFRPDAASVVKPSELPELLRRFAPASSAALGPQMESRITALIERVVSTQPCGCSTEKGCSVNEDGLEPPTGYHCKFAHHALLAAIRSLASAPRESEPALSEEEQLTLSRVRRFLEIKEQLHEGPNSVWNATVRELRVLLRLAERSRAPSPEPSEDTP